MLASPAEFIRGNQEQRGPPRGLWRGFLPNNGFDLEGVGTPKGLILRGLEPLSGTRGTAPATFDP
eukprot:5639864-Pyramimonas_sp.AAC.2